MMQLVAGFQNLTAFVGARFQVDMVTTDGLARFGVFAPVCCRQGMVGTAHIALGFAGFSLWYGHGLNP